MQGLSSLHDSTMRTANESLQQAKLTYREALEINTEASSIAIPPIDTSVLKAQGSPHSWEFPILLNEHRFQ